MPRPLTPPPSLPRVGRAALLVLALVAVAVEGCYQDPQAQLDEAQAQLDLSTTLEDLGSRSADLAFQLDSLRAVVARQDTVLARLANLAGVPYPR